ncbi:MAG: HEAT repeat domain-containing protein [Phototrophicaceae bacterium]
MTNFLNVPNVQRMFTDGDEAGLIDALYHHKPVVRQEAAIALADLGSLSASTILLTLMDNETDIKTRQAYWRALAKLGVELEEEPIEDTVTVSRIDRLVQHLNSGVADASIQAASALAEMNAQSAVPTLLQVFKTDEYPPAVRLAAAKALLTLNQATPEMMLLRGIQYTDWKVRRNSAAVLGALHADWAVEPLGKLLYDTHESVARTAQNALERIATPEAQQVIQQAKEFLMKTVVNLDEDLINSILNQVELDKDTPTSLNRPLGLNREMRRLNIGRDANR